MKTQKAEEIGALVLGTLAVGGGGYFLLKAFGVFEPDRYQEVITLPGTKQEFVSQMMSAMASMENLSLQTKTLIAAHGAYESGWGKGTAFKKGLNAWNITAGTAWGGAVVAGPDTEYSAGSTTAKKITQAFRSYPTLTDGITDYLAFLQGNRGRYMDGYNKLMAGDPSFVVDLGTYDYGPDGKLVAVYPGGTKGGYYTLPITDYAKNFNSILSTVSKLVTNIA